MDLVFIGNFVGAFLMISVFTLLYKENPISRVAEHAMIGVAAGYTFVTNFWFMWNTGVVGIFNGNPQYIIAIVLGALLFTNLSKKWAWLSRYGLALITGAGVALAISRVVLTDILVQMVTVVNPFLTLSTPISWVNATLMLVITLSVLSYFLFTNKARGTKLGPITKFGRYAMMLSFGMQYGQTATYRINMAIGRLDALLAPNMRNYSYMMAAIALALVIYWDLRMRKN
jgi:hypothetical protein